MFTWPLGPCVIRGSGAWGRGEPSYLDLQSTQDDGPETLCFGITATILGTLELQVGIQSSTRGLVGIFKAEDIGLLRMQQLRSPKQHPSMVEPWKQQEMRAVKGWARLACEPNLKIMKTIIETSTVVRALKDHQRAKVYTRRINSLSFAGLEFTAFLVQAQ